MIEEGLRFILLQYFSFVHKQDPGSNLSGKAHLMGHDHHGHTFHRKLLH